MSSVLLNKYFGKMINFTLHIENPANYGPVKTTKT